MCSRGQAWGMRPGPCKMRVPSIEEIRYNLRGACNTTYRSMHVNSERDLVHLMLGTTTTRMPAALDACTPLGASSITRHCSGATPIFCAVARKQSGAGLPCSTSSPHFVVCAGQVSNFWHSSLRNMNSGNLHCIYQSVDKIYLEDSSESLCCLPRHFSFVRCTRCTGCQSKGYSMAVQVPQQSCGSRHQPSILPPAPAQSSLAFGMEKWKSAGKGLERKGSCLCSRALESLPCLQERLALVKQLLSGDVLHVQQIYSGLPSVNGFAPNCSFLDCCSKLLAMLLQD